MENIRKKCYYNFLNPFHSLIFSKGRETIFAVKLITNMDSVGFNFNILIHVHLFSPEFAFMKNPLIFISFFFVFVNKII